MITQRAPRGLSLRSSAHILRSAFLFLATLFVLTNTAYAATITVAAGGDLQAAINAAASGDTILLEAGAVFVGPFELPNKANVTDYITIRTSASKKQGGRI